jgi:hypothetical protein
VRGGDGKVGRGGGGEAVCPVVVVQPERAERCGDAPHGARDLHGERQLGDLAGAHALAPRAAGDVDKGLTLHRVHVYLLYARR